MLKIAEELFAKSGMDPEDAKPLALAIFEVREKVPKLATLQPVMEAIDNVETTIRQRAEGKAEPAGERVVVSLIEDTSVWEMRGNGRATRTARTEERHLQTSASGRSPSCGLRTQELLRSRCARGRYDSAHRVDLASYERWLPKHLREAFRHYEEGLSLRVIENEAVDLVPSLDDRHLADLIYQLDRDVVRAEGETDRQALDRWFGGGG